jgi:hypothetical protein
VWRCGGNQPQKARVHKAALIIGLVEMNNGIVILPFSRRCVMELSINMSDKDRLLILET